MCLLVRIDFCLNIMVEMELSCLAGVCALHMLSLLYVRLKLTAGIAAQRMFKLSSNTAFAQDTECGECVHTGEGRHCGLVKECRLSGTHV